MPNIARFLIRFARIAFCSAMSVAAIMVLLWFPTPGQARPLQEVISSGELRVCFAPIHASVVRAEPADCREDCRFSGPAFEAVQAFVDFLGHDLRLRGLRVGWEEQFANEHGRIVRGAAYTPALLASGQCDLYPNNLTKTPWRLEKMDIATMFTNRLIVLVNGLDRDSFAGPSDLGGKVAVVEKDTSFHTWLQQQNNTFYADNPMDIQLMPTADALGRLDSRTADFTVIDADAAFWIIRHQFSQLYMAFPVGAMEEVGWGLRKGDADLKAAVQTFFAQQRGDRNSALNSIWDRHFGMNLNQFIGLLGSIQE